MQRIGLGVITTVTLAIAALGATPANADTIVVCNPKTKVCKTIVTTPGEPAHTSPTDTRGSSGKKSSAKADRCKTMVAFPQPPKSDPIWEGHLTGTILVAPCWLLEQMDGRMFWAPEAPDGAAEATVSPAVLARRALAQMQIPKPVIHRSPGESATGAPVTWVNVWTWVWTTPASWRPLAKTASLGTVWATVTVKPTELVFRPGLGGVPVSCTGPGRAWTPADSTGPPTAGGCGHKYRTVSAGVRATLAIRWAVTWRGSGDSSGELPAMTTQASNTFAVEQIQAVNQ